MYYHFNMDNTFIKGDNMQEILQDLINEKKELLMNEVLKDVF